jgi:hypothetical protein
MKAVWTKEMEDCEICNFFYFSFVKVGVCVVSCYVRVLCERCVEKQENQERGRGKKKSNIKTERG